jgi:hypothetical protein
MPAIRIRHLRWFAVKLVDIGSVILWFSGSPGNLQCGAVTDGQRSPSARVAVYHRLALDFTVVYEDPAAGAVPVGTML